MNQVFYIINYYNKGVDTMSRKKYLVYKHTNKVNGLVYIGITCQKPKRRWKNGKGYIENEYFWEDIEKYGWDGFDHEILYSGLSETQAVVLEVSLIAYYDLTNREKGYNKSEGGDIVSEESRRKMSETRKGMVRSEEHCRNLSKSLKGHTVSEKTRKKQSEAKKGRTGAKCPNSKTVICLTTGEVFESVKEAKRLTGISQGNISSVCRRERNYAGKLPDGTPLKWKYIKDLPKPQVPEDIKQLLRNGPKPLQLVC